MIHMVALPYHFSDVIPVERIALGGLETALLELFPESGKEKPRGFVLRCP